MDSIILADGSFAYIDTFEKPFPITTTLKSLLTVKGQITSAKLDKPIEIRGIAFMDILELSLFHYTLILKT